MTLLLALVAATALSPQSTQDVRCVALLGIVAYEQGRDSEWRDMPPIKADGERFAGVVGERVMKETGKTREAVKELILADVAALQKSKAFPREQVDTCIARMAAVAPPPATPDLPRCAAIMALTAQNVKEREGLSKGAKDLATLASVLAYRARVEGAATGKTESQIAQSISTEQAAAKAQAGIDEGELQVCADLAAAD